MWALDESLRYVERPMTHVFSTGVRPVFEVTTSSGRRVRATANHPFLSYAGWQALGDLSLGDRIAVPRHVPAPSMRDESFSDDDVTTAARLVAELPEARVPSGIGRLPKAQIALFLRELFTRAGGVGLATTHAGGEIFCFADDRERLDRIALLLLRFGISSQVWGGGCDWVLDVVDLDSQRRFLQEIGVEGGEGDRLLTIVRTDTRPAPDTNPVWREVAAAVAGGAPADRGTLAQVAAVLDRADVDLTAVNDVEWDMIVGIEPAGVEEVFDATVLGTHNFVANGVVVHNSIEQDADMVMLLHRPDSIDRDDPRGGEADIILGKHRNGPTANITVAHQLHFSRFTNMAR